jgi:putative transposase
MALVRLEEFEVEWGKRYPAIGAAWRRPDGQAKPLTTVEPALRLAIHTCGRHRHIVRRVRDASGFRARL